MDQELTEAAVQLFVEKMRSINTAADRAITRAAIEHGLTYQQWRQRYVRDLPANLDQVFRRMDAEGVDVEACLRAMYDEMTKQAVN